MHTRHEEAIQFAATFHVELTLQALHCFQIGMSEEDTYLRLQDIMFLFKATPLEFKECVSTCYDTAPGWTKDLDMHSFTTGYKASTV